MCFRILPIDEKLAEIRQKLDSAQGVVVIAPPGAGKTTRVPPALLPADRKLILLQPRRIAARTAAARIAAEQGWQLGREVGYQVRFDKRIDRQTRIHVLTEGLLTRKLQSDPFLTEFGCVVLDEFHERNLHVDLALSLLREVQTSVRPDLKLVVMSATLAAEPVSTFLGNCPVVRASGRTYPLTVSYVDARPNDPPYRRAASGVRRALAAMHADQQSTGDVLVFLPGAGAIRQTAEALSDLDDVDLVPLHGSLNADHQDRALRKGPRQRVVLATNVAETSITVDGITAVVDTGIARLPRYNPQTGVDRLDTVPISQASADQRAGRAGRLAPGRVYRLWSEASHASRPAETAPEVRRVDLSHAVLQLHLWGVDPNRFNWLDPPERGALARAESLLNLLGAVDVQGRVTDYGRQMAQLPAHPRLARLLIAAAEGGATRDGAAIVALLSERDILARHLYGKNDRDRPTEDSDILMRLRLLGEAERAQFRGQTLAEEVDISAAKYVIRARDQLLESTDVGTQAGKLPDDHQLLQLILHAFPDRVVRRRAPRSTRGVMVGGRGVELDPKSVVRDAPLFVAVTLEDRRSQSWIRIASRIEREWLTTESRIEHRFDVESERVVATCGHYYGDLCLDERTVAPDPEAAGNALAKAAATALHRALSLDENTTRLTDRLDSLREWMPALKLPSFDQDAWRALLPELCLGRRSFAELRDVDLAAHIYGKLSYTQRHALDRHAPTHYTIPSGRDVQLDYQRGKPPILAAPIQELFGLEQTPRVAEGRVAVLVHLLAPNRRPVQVTQDLASFWRTTYHDVRRDLRARYAKHAWPEDPLGATPTRRPRRRHKRR